MIKNGEYYIVSGRFAWIDSLQYDYVYGKCSILDAEKEIGFQLKRSENWFLKVEGKSGEVIIPGCRVDSVVKTNVKPIPLPDVNSEKDKSWRDYPVRILIL